jgi:hypothetical protein
MDLKRRVQEIYGEFKIQKDKLLKLQSTRTLNIVLLIGALAFACVVFYFYSFSQKDIGIARSRLKKQRKPVALLKLIPWIGTVNITSRFDIFSLLSYDSFLICV